MKIIHFIPSINKKDGGTTAYMQLLSKALGKMVELHVVTHRSEDDVPIEEAAVHYIPSRITNGMRRSWNQLLDSLKPEVVHVNCCWLPVCALVQRWAKRKGYPVILTPHGMLEPWIMERNYWTKKLPALLLYQRAAIKQADFLHATAQSEEDNLLKLGYNKRISIIPNGIDVDNIQIKKVWEKRNNILFLSRVHEKKGIEILLQALFELKDHLQNTTVTIAGDGEPGYVEKLKNLVEQQGLQKVVSFIGGVYGPTKWELFRETDIFILPTYSENFGIVVAEALACGTPVITTTGTPWSVLQDNQCGWCVATDTFAIKGAIKEAMDLSVNFLQKYGERGRKLVEERFSISAVSDQMIALYNTVLQKK